MPKQRFLNLPKEKQDTILAAATEEMCRVPYEELSINQIIQRAGIPRGSFYQYFADKADLVDYLMEDYGSLAKESARQTLRQTGGDLFAVASDMLRCTIQFGTSGNNYAFCRNIFAHLRMDHERSFPVLRYNTEQLLDEFMPHLRVDGWRYKSRAEVAALLDVLLAMLHRAVVLVFSDITKIDKVQQDFDRQVEMLKYGVLEREGTTDGQV